MLGRFWHWLMAPPDQKGTIAPKEVAKEPEKAPVEAPALNNLAVFAEDEMLIYQYYDGKKMVRADPMVLWKRASEKLAELQVDIKLAQTEGPAMEKVANEAYYKALEKIRYIFNVAPLDEDGGLTEGKTFDLFWHFMDFVYEVKKNSNPPPT